MKSDLWITEKQTQDMKVSFRVRNTVHEEKTEYQHLSIVDTYTYGRMLFLDNCVMTSIRDEYVYHEMLTLVPLNTHPKPANVLIVGGGDGGTVREAVKHPGVEKVTLVEIDGRVIETAKEYMPEIAAAFDSSKLEVIVDDGIKHIKENKETYDIVLIDSTDPVGPAVGLFSREFYQDVHRSLKEDGIMVAQTESPFLGKDLIAEIHDNLRSVYPIVKLYLASIPTYPTGLWSFSLASKKYDPTEVERGKIYAEGTRYYNKDIHFTSFVLPNFVAEIFLKKD